MSTVRLFHGSSARFLSGCDISVCGRCWTDDVLGERTFIISGYELLESMFVIGVFLRGFSLCALLGGLTSLDTLDHRVFIQREKLHELCLFDFRREHDWGHVRVSSSGMVSLPF